jgi:DNA-binding NtrC family response regulator
MKFVLVIGTDQKICHKIRSCCGDGYQVNCVESIPAALTKLSAKRHDFVFIALDVLRADPCGDNFKATFARFWDLYPSLDIIVMAPKDMTRKAVTAVKMGARDYINYPIDPEEVKFVSENILNSNIIQSELSYLRDQFWQAEDLELIQTQSPKMTSVFAKIRSVAPTRSTVLLIGETGTGKNLLAKLIHNHSNRRKAQFISVHCGAIPDTLIESELFGHEKGAFTGAIRRKLGKFEIAQGGTIFLDEIGTITPSAQIKLLQVLQDGSFQRVGGEENLKADVRVIAASNSDLKELTVEGSFRKDLYYRLNVFPIEIPPLQERLEDIPYLCEVLLKKLIPYHNKEIDGIHPMVLAAFKSYNWPGNIRELENLIERAAILETSRQLTPESFPAELFQEGANTQLLSTDSDRTLAETRRLAIEDIERRYLKDCLGRHHGKINAAAHAAGITTRQLNKLMNKYGIRKEDFKP